MICTGGPYRYAYYLEDDELHWIAPHGTGLVATGIAASQAIAFPEATVDVSGHASARSTSMVYVSGGRLMRLDGSSPCPSPPPPKPISSLTDIAKICRGFAISDLADRSKSRLVFQYGQPTDAATPCGGLSRPTWSIPLAADGTTAPTALVQDVVPAVRPMGTVDAAITTGGEGQIARVASLADATIAKVLVPEDLSRGAFSGLTATWIGDGHYLLTAYRLNKSETELYLYDATTDTASPVRGRFNAAFAIKPTERDANYLYFSAAPFGGQQGIYRLKRDGSASAELLAGSPSAQSFTVAVIGVLDGMLYFTQPGTSGVDVWRHATSIDFASPPAASSVVKTVSTSFMVSSTHLFYRPNANFISAVGLDGTKAATYQVGGSPPLASWAGCSAAVDEIDPVGAVRCGRVLAHVVDNAAAPWQNHLVSFDATAGGDVSTALFASATRDEKELGSYAGYSNLGTKLLTTAPDPFLRVDFDATDTIGDNSRRGIAAAGDLTAPANVQVLLGPAGVSRSWLE